jgi:hypothetical protein
MATYGSFPGVRVETESGGIQSVEIGAEEKLVFFGEANYVVNGTNDGLIVEGDDATLDVNANESEQINAPRVADLKFGSDTELAEAMKNSLGNGANIDFLYGVPVQRKVVEAETQTSQSGTLDNVELVENTGTPVDLAGGSVNDFGIDVTDTGTGTIDNVELRYGVPSQPSDGETVFINPLTGEYAADAAPDTEYQFDYTHNEYGNAFEASDPKNIVNEDETGIFFALSDSDSASADLNNVVNNLRTDYQLVNALSFAQPNSNELFDAANTTIENGGADARFDVDNYSKGSVSAAYYYKFAPGREENVDKTVGGGIGGLFAGNPINDPIYNEVVSGYDALEQSLGKSEADKLRDADVIPLRSGGNVRVKGNRATSFSVSDTVAADFWTRRITDRVILIGKQIGDAIIGRINDEETRALAERRINQEMRSLESQRLIRPNTGTETNWNVTAYEDPTNSDEVNIDISFTPYGIVKNVDETITVDTN